jgi:hypothetical protein
MASARSTYRDGQDGDGAAAAAHPFVWVSLRDPSPEELAAVQREFGLPVLLVDGLATAARRPVLELTASCCSRWSGQPPGWPPRRPSGSGRSSWCSATASWSASTATGPCWSASARTWRPLGADSSTAAGERLKQRYRERRAHLLHLVELADGDRC